MFLNCKKRGQIKKNTNPTNRAVIALEGTEIISIKRLHVYEAVPFL